MVVGTTDASDSEQTTPWASSDGKFWVSLDNTAYDAFCPALKNPVIAHYGGKYYVFGSETANKLDVIYASPDGISWRETKEKFLLSEDISKISAPYSMIVDDPYIWIVFDGAEGANAVWRGYLNKLLFEKQ